MSELFHRAKAACGAPSESGFSESLCRVTENISRRFGGALGVAFVALGLVFALGGETSAAGKTAKAQPSFFNTVEVQSNNLKSFKKWRAALARYQKEKSNTKKLSCDAKRLNICDYGDWAKFIDSLKGQSQFAQLKAVNARMNKARYTTDKTNWGQNDYWATPGEFMARFGDCEDYAIVKYLSLRLLGFTDGQLRVVAVKDLNLKVGHAILVAIIRDSKNRERYLVLDNQIEKIVEAKTIRHYQPVFSINSESWWRHLPRSAAG